jgi:phosphatidate cytidylyltransferase
MSDFKQRLLYSTIFIVFATVFLYFAYHPWFQPVFVAAIAAISGGALWEYFQLAKSKGIHVPAKIGLLGSVIYIYSIFISIHWPNLLALPEIVLGAILIAIFFHQFLTVKNALITTSVTFFGIVYIVVTLACMIKITYFFLNEHSQDGRWWLVYLLAVTKMTDIGGLFVGRLLGRIKLAKSLSPKKTVEGALGGMLFGLLTSIAFSLLSQKTSLISIDLPLSHAFGLGILISILGQFGDLAESLLKRDGGVKDSNSHLPGLGGMLDIVDSLIFTTPFVYLFLLISGAK